MPAYVTPAQLRAYLEQLRPDQYPDVALQPVLNRARSVIDGVLGFGFFDDGAAWPAASALTVRAERSQWLRLPPYRQGAITSVRPYGETTAIADWEEAWDGGVGCLYRDARWDATRYTIIAPWGYGPAPDSVVEVNLELAVNIWRGKGAGHFSDVVGAEGGGAIGYARALTAQQKLVLANVRQRYKDAFQ